MHFVLNYHTVYGLTWLQRFCQDFPYFRRCDFCIFLLQYSVWSALISKSNFRYCRCYCFTNSQKKTGKKVKERIAVSGIPSHSYGTSLTIWDHTVLPATRHKWTRSPSPQPEGRYSIYLPRRDGRLSWLRLPGNAPAGNRTRDLSITSPTPYYYTIPSNPYRVSN